MTDRPSRPRKIRTNVRFYLLRQALRLLARVAPAAAESWALRLWSTPRRPAPPRPPQVPELPARPLEVALDGAPLAAWSWGQGPAVLLVHGWSGYAGQMTGFVAPLVAAGFRVIAFDHPAHGQSPGRTSNSLRMRDAVLAVARAAGPVHALIAHSLGAAAAVMAVVQGLRVERAVLVAPPAEAPSFARAFAAAIGLSPARTEGMLARAQRRLGIDFSALDLRLIGPQMRLPLLVVHDPGDREVPFSHGQAVAAAWPGARLHTTEGLGHNRPLRAAAVIEEAVAFVGPPARLAATGS